MFLYQNVTEFTCYREGQNSSILDLILNNEEGIVNDIKYITLLCKSDHVCLAFNTNMYASTLEKIKPKYTYDRENYKNITENLKHLTKRLEYINTENVWVFL